MPSQQVPVLYHSWAGGRNDSKSLLALNRNELAEISNFFVAQDGHLKKRAGFSKVYDTTPIASNIAHGMIQTRIGTTRYLVTTAGTAIYKDDSGTITGTATLTAGADKPVVMATFKDLLIGCQSDTTVGLNAPFAWSGSGNAAALTTSPPSLAVTVSPFKNRVVFGNVTFGGTAYPEAIVFPKVNTATTWPTNQIIQIYPGTGRYIAASLPFAADMSESDKEVLLIWKDNGLFMLRHRVLSVGALTSAFVQDAIPDAGGCPAPLGPIAVDNIAYWPSYRGFYMMGPDLQPQYIGRPLEVFWTTVPKNRIPHIKSAYLQDLGQIWFTISGAGSAGGTQTTNNKICVWSTVFRRWVGIHSGINANVMCEFQDSNLNRYVYSSDYTDFLIYKQNTGTSDGVSTTGIAASFKTGFLDLGNPGTQKSFRKFILELGTDAVKQYQVNITLYNVTGAQGLALESGEAGVVLDQFMLDTDLLAGPEYGQVWARIGGKARYAQVELVTQANTQDLDVYGLGFYIVPRRASAGVKR